MKILNTKAIQSVDHATCEAQNISTIDLMERAASVVSCELISRFLPGKRFVIIAGPGNNGGDALDAHRARLQEGGGIPLQCNR